MMDRRKELKEQYKQLKPEMGVFLIKSSADHRYYLEAASNVNGAVNRARFQLGAGSHPNRELQKAWREQGESGFSVEIPELLAYDKDESKTDYSEELELLQMIWEEKLAKEGWQKYSK